MRQIAAVDAHRLADKLSTMASKVDSILRWHSWDFSQEMDLVNCASSLRAVARHLMQDDEPKVTRCIQCGLMVVDGSEHTCSQT